MQSVGSGRTIEGVQDFFTWTYKDLKGIPPELAKHIIELDIIIPSTHQAKYRLNPKYATIIKQDIDKLLATIFIQFIEGATWLSPIIIVLKKNGKLKNYIDFKKLSATTKKDPYHYLLQMKR